jgi:anaerobic ribonucleoside-triphosphate reductase activating protein
MAQAAGLAQVIRLARRQRDLTLICFTGYRLEQLRASPPQSGVLDLLSETDVLIDGPYIASRNDGRGLRGSNNQRINLLTDRLAQERENLATGPRRAEIRFRMHSALLVGVPDRLVSQTFGQLPGGGAISEL